MMKQNNDNHVTELDKNLSRLLKQTGEPGRPSRTFIESLKNHALNELIKNAEAKNIAARSDWLEKTMGWAAMIAAAFGAGLVVIISFALKMNLLLEVVVVLTLVFNWISSLGGHI